MANKISRDILEKRLLKEAKLKNKQEAPIQVTGDQAILEKEGEQWTKQEVGAVSEPLIDTAQGKPIVIRAFTFELNPALKKFPSKQDLFYSHQRGVLAFMMKDGLIPIEGIDPRVVINEDRTYQIFVTCEAKYRQSWQDKPRSLRELLPMKLAKK